MNLNNASKQMLIIAIGLTILILAKNFANKEEKK
jgi:hypothetical protein